jgi:hypothetical protein
MRRRRSWRVLGPLAFVLVVGAGALAPAAGALSFGAATPYDTGVKPAAVVVADFNGDDKPDMAVGTSSDPGVDVFIGDGAGGFGAPASYTAPGGVEDLAVGDFNGDGKLDLAVATMTEAFSGNLGILLGDGAGGFGAPTSYATSPQANGVAVADLDGDGDQDVVTADGCSFPPGAGNIGVFMGDGAGAFSGPTYLYDGPWFLAVALADFNGDGKPDLAACRHYDDLVSVALGDGAGGFGALTDFATGDYPSRVVTGDFNGDGTPDLAVSEGLATSAGVLLGDGAGGFGPRADYAVVGAPWGITTGDFNSDGRLDLATAGMSNGSADVILGDGAGTFGAPTALSIPGGFRLWAIAAADLSGDGKQDLVVADWATDKVHVLPGEWEVPCGSIELDGGAAYTSTRDVTVDSTVAEAKEMRIRDAGGVWSEWIALDRAAPWTLPAGDGEKTVEVQFRSPAGSSEVVSDSIVLHAEGPRATVTGGRSGWGRRPVRLRFTGVAGPGGIAVARTEYRVGGGAWVSGASVKVSAQGATRVEYRAVDVLGLAGPARRCTVRIDSRRPRVVAAGLSGPAGGAVRLPYTITDPAPGCGTALVRLAVVDGAGRALTRSSSRPVTTNARHTLRVSTRSLRPGTYLVVLRAVDRAGNYQRGVTRAWLTVR